MFGPCLQLAMLLTSCRSALSRSCCSFRCSVRHYFASRAVSAPRRRCLRVRLSRSASAELTSPMRGLGGVKVLAVSTGCSLVHVLTLTCVFVSACSLTGCSSAHTFAWCAWSAGLTSTALLPLQALCVEVLVAPALRRCAALVRSR